MPRHSHTKVAFAVADRPFEFSARAVEGLPEAPAFIAHLLKRGVAAHTAVVYVTHVARLRRQGKLTAVDAITNVTARTAANAFNRYVTELRAASVAQLHALFPAELHERFSFLRVHSCVGAYPGKTVPPMRGWHNTPMGSTVVDTETKLVTYTNDVPWEPCDMPTLHVPKHEVAAHADPCETCEVVRLTQEQVAAVLAAVTVVWGHANLAVLDPTAPLLGGVSIDMPDPAFAPLRTLGLSEPNPVARGVARLHGEIVTNADTFISLLRADTDGVYLSREACHEKLDDVLNAIRAAWT